MNLRKNIFVRCSNPNRYLDLSNISYLLENKNRHQIFDFTFGTNMISIGQLACYIYHAVTKPEGGLGGSIPPWKLQIPGGEYRLITCRKPKSNFFVWRSPPKKISGCVPDSNLISFDRDIATDFLSICFNFLRKPFYSRCTQGMKKEQRKKKFYYTNAGRLFVGQR